MERSKFDYSLNNISIPLRNSYQLQLIDKIESVIKRMGWKEHFSLTVDNMNKETCVSSEITTLAS